MALGKVFALAPRTAQVERLTEAIALPIARWDRQTRLAYCNTAYVRWADQPRDRLMGRAVEELFGAIAWETARPAFFKALNGVTGSYDRLVTHRVDSPRWARVQVVPDASSTGTVSGVYTIAFDIHDQVAAREEVQAMHRRLDKFTENIPFPLAYVDRDFVLRFVNKAHVAAGGVPREELLGRHMSELPGLQGWVEQEPYFKRALDGETVHYTRFAQLVHPGPRWVRTSYTPDFDETGQIAGVYTTTVDIHDLTLAEQALRRSVERDALTDVLSRRAVMNRIDAAAARCLTDPFALFFIDIDRFSTVNDQLGHEAGDILLTSVAAELQGAVRGEDAVGRLGGDEFLVVARLQDAKSAAVLASHLVEAVRRGGGAINMSSPLSASVGYALAPADTQCPFELVRRADVAMFNAKRKGGDCARYCGEAALE